MKKLAIICTAVFALGLTAPVLANTLGNENPTEIVVKGKDKKKKKKKCKKAKACCKKSTAKSCNKKVEKNAEKTIEKKD
ncbi:MAG: hypothetical protein ACJAY8_000683 [Sphingobacteriales bacterium]|jgi:hypothetical protein